MAQNVYSTCSLPYSTGCFLYTDSGLTTPAANGIYSDGTNTYTVTGGAGEITSVSTCAAASTTTTSTTSTTTTATPPPSINFYGVMGNTSLTNGVLYYSTDQITWTPVAQPFTNSCGLIDAVVVNSGDTVYISIGDPSSTTYFYNAQVGQTCPSNSPTYCGVGSAFSIVVNSNTDVAITQYVSGGDIVPCSTTSTTSTTTTAAPTTTSTTTTTTAAPTTTSTTTTTTLFTNLTFDLTTGAGGYTIGGIDVNAVIPTLTGGTDVPFNSDTHDYNTNQIGTNETLNIFVSALSLNGCITVTDSASNVFQQNITATGTYSFTGLTIDNTTAVLVLCADNAC